MIASLPFGGAAPQPLTGTTIMLGGLIHMVLLIAYGALFALLLPRRISVAAAYALGARGRRTALATTRASVRTDRLTPRRLVARVPYGPEFWAEWSSWVERNSELHSTATTECTVR